ncbi:AAA family ATPase [uncultured Anaerococcus sp.]|uniref:ATP-binding protein n=1 Tax=uncultured Anaerococcus sp. TaxID=293428 RepID=UPI002889D8CE|nr:AAA family ATPase [uncultured Anaerococcus sp.]
MTRIYIEELNIKSFGKFQNKTIRLDPSFNLIYGLNESGKTTIKNFIEGMFYGFDEGKLRISFSNKRENYRPKSSYIYAGEIKLIKDGQKYLLFRDFDSGDYRISNLSENKEVKLKKSDLNAPGKYFLGVDYDIYKSYISSEQIQEISQDSKKKVLEKLASSDIDYKFSIKNSLEILDNRLKEIGTDRAYTKPYYKTKEKIKDLEEQISEIDRLKKDFYQSYQKLDEEKNILAINEKNCERKKQVNQIFNKKRSDDNFKSYRNWSDKLFGIDKELESYDDLKGMEFDWISEEKTENRIDYRIIYFFACIAIILMATILRKFYLLLLVFPFIYIIYKQTNKDGGKNSSEYNNLRRRFLKYENLLSERGKIVEVLDILKKQDLAFNKGEEEIDFDLDDYDNLKELDEIARLEKEIKESRLRIHSQEKSLLSIDNILQNEAGLRDELRYQSEKLNKLQDEIEAISIAKKIILEIANENRAEIYKLNKELKTILEESSKSEFDISFNKSLDIEIRDKSSFTYDEKQLSKGYFDQVNFAMKLSLAKQSIKDTFLILDDAFINYDIERLRRFLYLILDESLTRQIIYFTCHKREKEFFDVENISVNFIQLEDR